MVEKTCIQKSKKATHIYCQEGNNYYDAEDLFDTIKTQFKEHLHVEFHGTYLVDQDPMIADKSCTQMAAEEIWKLTGYRFM